MNDAPRAAAPALRLTGLTRRYKSGDSELLVLDRIDLDISPGEIVGLIGPSGSGKSSLLHAAGMLEKPSDGEVFIEGHSGWSLSDERRTAIRRNRIGFVYQFHHLLPEFDAIHNVALPAFIAGRPRREALAEGERLLGVMGLQSRVHHQPAQLSGGEQQRVAIARAMINRPALILADEPTGNLDVANGDQLMELLDKLHADGATLITVTHNPVYAERASRRIHMLDGRLRADA
jgi:lipoprotein-releasing system ATP-binding protein